ncbi:hypothetical protein EES38_02650 [Vibrio viridaestus]|uniref:Uncharacterized protein n=1 Tax=Vibrio viridaestus TaxID=2487322 RepID=A0A3N9TLS6_9VIBR|nr:hypothetical protein EES38_02650 [Vibrio viridaestus]
MSIGNLPIAADLRALTGKSDMKSNDKYLSKRQFFIIYVIDYKTGGQVKFQAKKSQPRIWEVG